MSANPEPRLLEAGDLDLLISRSLDGDLPGEEERELQSLLAADPSARARYEAMAALVGRLEELPEPETPFAMATRVAAQVEDDTKGLAASFHRFGFYFRPATLGVIGAGVVAVALAYTVKSPPKPTATVAEARGSAAKASDEGRVTVFLGGEEKQASKKKDSAPASAAEAKLAAAPPVAAGGRAGNSPAEQARALSDEAGAAHRSEPVLAAAAEAPRAKEEVGFAPERDAPAAPAAAPAPADRRQMADENAVESGAMQKAVAAEPMRSRATAPRVAGAVRASATTDVVGKASGALRLAAPARLEGLAGPFEGTYRLELDSTGRVSDVTRLFGGSGTEPAGLMERLKALSFVPDETARAAGSVDVRVRLP